MAFVNMYCIEDHQCMTDSDDDSFNSAISGVCDLYDDVLFQHTVVPKDQAQSSTQGTISRQRSDSFASAHSADQKSCTSADKQLNRFADKQLNRSFHTANDEDGQSCTSSHLLSSGPSNDDDLTFSTESLMTEVSEDEHYLSPPSRMTEGTIYTKDSMHQWDVPPSYEEIDPITLPGSDIDDDMINNLSGLDLRTNLPYTEVLTADSF